MFKKITIAFGLFWALVLVYAAAFGLRTTRLPVIQNLVAKNVKIGASPDEILYFLDNQQLEHSKLIRPEAMHIGPGHDYANLPIIVAIKRRTMQSLFVYESIEIVFVFDGRNELKRFDVIPILTGL
jgi:hypothetical protein